MVDQFALLAAVADVEGSVALDVVHVVLSLFSSEQAHTALPVRYAIHTLADTV